MAKINLLTIHWGNCFGAVMQTYATCQLLQEQGHEITVINLIPKEALQRFKAFKRFYKLDIIQDLLYLLFKRHNFPSMTRIMTELDNSKIPDADYTVVGSDQTWRPAITKGLYRNFFLDFVHSGEKISLASSLGVETIEDTLDDVQPLLADFSAISVRESSGVKILRDTFGIDAIQLIDPTLAYNNFSVFYRKNHKRYLYRFLFKYGDDEKLIVDAVSNHLNLTVFSKNRWDSKFKSGPLDVLNEIYNASFVIVSSFHGLAFSLMAHREFIVLCADEKCFSRIYSLLLLLGLENRYVNSFADLKNRMYLLDEHINYKEIDKILRVERDRFISFINCNIQ